MCFVVTRLLLCYLIMFYYIWILISSAELMLYGSFSESVADCDSVQIP